jgi:hypothetical protein
LQNGSHSQKRAVQTLEQREQESISGGEAKRSQDGDRAPHRGECRGPSQPPLSLLRMETCKQGATVGRAAKTMRIGYIDEIDRSTSIEPTHHRDFAPTKRAGTVMPDDQSIHGPIPVGLVEARLIALARP